MKKIMSIFGKGIIVILGILVCTMSLFTSRSSLAADRDQIIMSWKAEVNGLDCADTGGLHTDSVLSNIYETLLTFDKEFKIRPLLAESYETKDAQTWTFKLRKGVKFHDGTPFNAEVVRYNFDRVRGPDIYTKRALSKNGGMHTLIKEVKVIDDYTVQFICKHPYFALVYLMADTGYGFISPTAHKKYKADYANHPVGTGPYKFVSWRKKDRLIFERNDEYWRDRIEPINRPKRIVFHPIPEDGARIMALETGEVDVISMVPAYEIDRLKKDPRFIVHEIPSMQVIYIGMNQQVKPFGDVRVRKALNYAVNKEAIVKQILGGHGMVADSVCSPKAVWGAPVKLYEYNPAKAKELLAEAGYANGFKTRLIACPGTYQMDKEWLEVVLQNFRDVGVEVELMPTEWAVYTAWLYARPDEKGIKRNLVMYQRAWAPGAGESGYSLTACFHSRSKALGSNIPMYENPEVDRLIDKGLRAPDFDTVGKYFAEAQRIIMEDAVWIPLIVTNITLAYRKDVHNIIVFPYEPILLRDAYLK